MVGVGVSVGVSVGVGGATVGMGVRVGVGRRVSDSAPVVESLAQPRAPRNRASMRDAATAERRSLMELPRVVRSARRHDAREGASGWLVYVCCPWLGLLSLVFEQVVGANGHDFARVPVYTMGFRI